LIAANATFALKPGAWFRRVRLVIVSPDPRRSSPHSGRKATYPTVQILRASSKDGADVWLRIIMAIGNLGDPPTGARH
jgi:hypothetical protein